MFIRCEETPNPQTLKFIPDDRIILPSGTGEAAYKFTRGRWATVEGDASGNVIQNRTFTYSSNAIINVSILGWEDKKTGGGNNSTALPNVKLLSNNFYMPQLNKNRRIWIYLPNIINWAIN
jgi:alpha-glucosidase